MKSTLSKSQIKILLDGKTLSFGHNKFYISKTDQIYKILFGIYTDKYQTRKVIVDTKEKRFIIDNIWRISWTKSETEPEYTGDYKYADKDLNCKLVRGDDLHEELENGYIWYLLVKNRDDLDWHRISAFKWLDTDIEEQMLKVAEYSLNCEFLKADNLNKNFTEYMKEF